MGCLSVRGESSALGMQTIMLPAALAPAHHGPRPQEGPLSSAKGVCT